MTLEESALTNEPLEPNEDKLTFHLDRANVYHQALLKGEATNRHDIRLVHARQYHATMAAAYGTKELINELRGTQPRRIEGEEADDTANPGIKDGGIRPTDTQKDSSPGRPQTSRSTKAPRRNRP